jgi:hypothetical protein
MRGIHQALRSGVLALRICSGRSTCLTSTLTTFTPQGAVCWSRISAGAC